MPEGSGNDGYPDFVGTVELEHTGAFIRAGPRGQHIVNELDFHALERGCALKSSTDISSPFVRS